MFSPGGWVGYVLYLDRPGYRRALEQAETLTLHEDERIRNTAARAVRQHGGYYSHAAGDHVVLVLEDRRTVDACFEEIRWSLPGVPLKAGTAYGAIRQNEIGQACGVVVARAASMVEDVEGGAPAGVVREWLS
jgi:hypothetical protein